MDRYYVNDDGQIEDGHRPGAYQTLDEVEICTLLNRLSAAEAERDTERAARLEAEELAVWALRRDAYLKRADLDGPGRLRWWGYDTREHGTDCDDESDADILRALASAMEESEK